MRVATSNNAVGLISELVDGARERRGAAVMAVINTTPDSFFDGGKYTHHDAARRRVDEVLEQGADILDIGAESTRPGARAVAASEQLDRAAWTIEYAVSSGAAVSVDTTLVEVAEQAVRLGAKMINDVSCLGDPRLADVTRDAGVDLVIMHSRGSMTKMRDFSDYDPNAYEDVVADVRSEWQRAEQVARDRGLDGARIWFDPGLGFHKNAEHSAELMRRLEDFRDLGAGTLLGASRKSFIGALDGSPPDQRLGGSIAACLRAVEAGVKIVRVHDVQPVVQALVAHQAWRAESSCGPLSEAERPLSTRALPTREAAFDV